MAQKICSHCGYEGRGKRMGERRGGGAARVLGMLLMLPIYTLWKAMDSRSGKQCPHCGLPTMGKLNSGARRIARNKMDVELGLVQPPKPVEKKAVEGLVNEPSPEPRINKKPVDPEQW